MISGVQPTGQAEADINRIFNCLFEERTQGCSSYWNASPFRSPGDVYGDPGTPQAANNNCFRHAGING
jgi:hypothetical protein